MEDSGTMINSDTVFALYSRFERGSNKAICKERRIEYAEGSPEQVSKVSAISFLRLLLIPIKDNFLFDVFL